jgi:DsbC/DsbD-like thiol-disulfide interchange protein
MTRLSKRYLVVATGAFFFSVNLSARADDSSLWSEDNHAAIRLIAGGVDKVGKPRAGIEIKLDQGWKTYWRYPGDSGVPPRFDFAGSDNLAVAKVRYPAPHLFTDEAGNSLGYKDDVIFPVEVTPKQPGKPVVLHVKVDYAACEKLCVPAKGEAGLTLTGAKTDNDTMLDAAAARVPTPVSAAELGLTARRVNDAAKPLVAVDLKAAAQCAGAALCRRSDRGMGAARTQARAGRAGGPCTVRLRARRPATRRQPEELVRIDLHRHRG